MRRRQTDPEDFDPRPLREDGVRLGYKGFGLNVHGPQAATLLIVLILALAMAAALYLNYLGTQVSGIEHQAMIREQRRTTCVLSMTPEDRLALRQKWGPGALQGWCPWLEE
jgi:hypothetical protein